ncbi:MAG: hypothetical protein EBU05_02965 [Chitinophagia bacterium]|jgi:hypothetical protein|nr:hypothetical protein [Chitinophagia bacterium]
MKRVYTTTLGLMLSAVLLLGCFTIIKQTKGKVVQGIQGQVFEQRGNAMPQQGKPFSKGVGFATQLYVFEPTHIQSTSQISGSLFNQPSTKLIGTFTTDSIGRFKCILNPGRYSIFVGYQNGYYATGFNQLNELGIVQVLAGTFAPMEVIISAKASY